MGITRSGALAVMIVCGLGASAHPEPNKVLYELQKRCGKQASNKFKKEMGRTITRISQGKVIANYENHYNERLNKCFYLLEITTIETGGTSLRLFDLQENRDLANFLGFDGSAPTECQVGDNSCHTEQEWRSLVKPFMEE